MAKRKNVITIIVLIVAILLVLSVISVILLPHIGDKSNDDTLSLVVNGVKITENADIAIMGKTIEIDGCKDWKYQIVSNLAKNHIYYAEGAKGFDNGVDLGQSSGIENWQNGFTVTTSKSSIFVNNTTLLEVLQKIHNTKNVIIDGSENPLGLSLPAWTDDSQFKLVISSSDGKQSIALSFVIPIGG